MESSGGTISRWVLDWFARSASRLVSCATFLSEKASVVCLQILPLSQSVRVHSMRMQFWMMWYGGSVGPLACQVSDDRGPQKKMTDVLTYDNLDLVKRMHSFASEESTGS